MREGETYPSPSGTSLIHNRATRDQIVALQTLYSEWSKHTIGAAGDPRSARLEWASQNIGHAVSSFADLTLDEARRLIDRLKGSMGQQIGERPHPWRKVRSRDRAHAAGTAGRRDGNSQLLQIASADDLARIDEALARLGWSRDRYEAWLRSASSPLNGKESCAIRTVAEANRVWWALKNMLKRSGNWKAPQKRVRRTLSTSA